MICPTMACQEFNIPKASHHAALADVFEPVRLGVCAMEKKVGSKPMQAILAAMTRKGDIQVVNFPEQMILEQPVEKWPDDVDCLISFFSDGFPLDKAEAYVALRKLYCINDVTSQRILLDRRRVYALLKENGIPLPQAVFVERDAATGALLGDAAEYFEESDDYIIVGKTKISKPFVEKPIDAEDHNIWIYYPSSAGGGVKRLFRKVGDRSSSFHPEARHVRKDGSYLYEPFMKTQGTDIKVYTVGPQYAHAEARKSPVIDGIVNRDKEGKEVRFPVVLTPREKEMAMRVCLAFGQTVCGFDMLRTTQGSYVIDVNGWSFVKGIQKYYEDTAALLRAHIFNAVGKSPPVRRVESAVPHCVEFALDHEDPGDLKDIRMCRSDRWEHEELLAVIGVMRHGDRTPKNKMKLVTALAEFVGLHKRWASGPKKEAKLKTPIQLQAVLDITYKLIGHEGESMERKDMFDERTAESIALIRSVLETGGSFDGIYRKVQLKPLAWETGTDEVKEVLVVLKYGGILTPAGVQQAETIGKSFRNEMYPGEADVLEADGRYSSGLLRLHATQRHDFKVYSADEGRVQMSAASFSRGLLDLEKGSLTPICVALVETDSMMLDDLPSAALPLLEGAKQVLHNSITGDRDAKLPVPPPGQPSEFSVTTPTGSQQSANFGAVVLNLENVSEDKFSIPVSVMLGDFTQLKHHIDELCVELQEVQASRCSEVTKPLLVRKRWAKLREEVWDKKRGCWNISKMSEIHDAVKFDLIHHPSLATNFAHVYNTVKRINNAVVPNEYGWDAQSRVRIGSVVCGRLLKKIMIDFNNTVCVENQDQSLPSWRFTPALRFLRRLTKAKAAAKEENAQALPDPVEPNVHINDGNVDDDEVDICNEAEFAALDPIGTNVRTPHRRVRTRLYFTSESHIHTLMNVLRYCHLVAPRSDTPCDRSDTPCERGKTRNSAGHHIECESTPDCEDPEASSDHANCPIVCEDVEKNLQEDCIFDYLTQIVFRLYEDKRAPQNSPNRYRVEVLFSRGACLYPSNSEPCGKPDIEPLQPLHATGEPLTYARLQELLGALI